jgi:hypothetical protein
MKSFLHFAALSCVVAKVLATHGGQEIPEIESVVASMTQEFGPAVTYAGPTEAHRSHYSTRHPTATPTPASYWLADIKHQGVAAFNPDTTYQVFRNVKDFGAKGEFIGYTNTFFSDRGCRGWGHRRYCGYTVGHQQRRKMCSRLGV